MLVDEVLTQFGLTAPGQAGIRLHMQMMKVVWLQRPVAGTLRFPAHHAFGKSDRKLAGSTTCDGDRTPVELQTRCFQPQ